VRQQQHTRRHVPGPGRSQLASLDKTKVRFIATATKARNQNAKQDRSVATWAAASSTTGVPKMGSAEEKTSAKKILNLIIKIN
jgi:hypothetical protein